MNRLILASSSPQRRRLLEEAGFRFESVAPDVDESSLPDEDPTDLVLRLARLKAAAVVTDAVVLGADTVVVAGGALLAKPIDEDDAASMLARLSGVTHQVLTGWAIVRDGRPHDDDVATSLVTFRELGQAEIRDYVATGEPLDKAGAYAIQGGAADFVETLKGSYRNVVGLPVGPVTVALAGAGVVPDQPAG